MLVGGAGKALTSMAKMTIKTNFHDNLAPFSQRKEAKLLNAKVAKCQGYIMAFGEGGD